MKDLNSKIEKLLKIYSIPIEEQWENYGDANSNTIYKYWLRLEIINKRQFDKFFKNKSLHANPILIRYFKSIDDHFNPKYYEKGEVADVGSGFGHITFWLVLSGAYKVHTIGDPERIMFIERLYKRAVEKRLISDNVILIKPDFIKVGDKTLSNTISSSSLDLVLLNDTLEHITPRIFPSLVKSVHNDLKPKGLFISHPKNSTLIKKTKF